MPVLFSHIHLEYQSPSCFSKCCTSLLNPRFNEVVSPLNSRIARESKTIEAMVSLYCRSHHQPRGLCLECAALLDYALARLKKCKFQEDKPTCAKCPVHCYKPDMREKTRAVMRYSGPRMIYRYPVLALRHIVDGRRK
ncbi:MAG: nitrous oxide-stimulated promoter family protein [Chloroflexota bacterium]